MTDAPRQPFWKRKRWIAAAVLWLAIRYPLAAGPSLFLVNRRLIPPELHSFVFGPAFALLGATPLRRTYLRYLILLAHPHWSAETREGWLEMEERWHPHD